MNRYGLLNNNQGMEGCIRDPGFDQNIFNLRYGEQYNVPISVPLNQTVIVWSVLYSWGHRQRLQSFKGPKKVNRKKKRGSHGWEREREETLPSPSSFLAVGEDGKKRGQIGKISASEGSRAVA